MELECDLGMIKNEELLRQMWQQSEDVNRKKEIRSHLYKLRESRLRDLYQSDIMASNSAPGFGKDPLTPCHGDSLVDQSFQSLKSKEIRDSISPPHDMKFHSITLNHPNTTGWDVQTSSEVSPDGRAYRTETLATTDGLEKINGGTAEFKGRNEQLSSASHQGDDKNFVKKAAESSNTHLHEKVVIGDENSGRTEMKTSSTTSSSSSKLVSSSSTMEHGSEPVGDKHLMDNSHHSRNQQHEQHVHKQQQQQQQQLQQEQRQYEQQHQQHQQQHQKHQQHQQQKQQHYTEEYNSNRQETSDSTNVETQKLHEETKRYVDVDKASPEYQRHVQKLMAQKGEIISNTVEYPKPNVKMITTVKRLPDGTIVKNKRYETEELRPATENIRQHSTSSTNQNTTKRRTDEKVSENQNTRQSNFDAVDNVETTRHTHDSNIHNNKQVIVPHPSDQYSEDVENVLSTFSSVKKSSRRFSTETTSETVEEYDDHSPAHVPNSKGKPSGHAPQDFSTHGFPSVKSNKPVQEYPTDRSSPARQTDNFSTHGFPSVRPNKPTQEYPTDRSQQVRSMDVQHTTERKVVPAAGKPSRDPEVIVVSSERTHSVKQKSNSERIIETEVVTDSDIPTTATRNTKQITTTSSSARPDHGFPAVKGTSPLRDSASSSPRRPQPTEDFSTHGFPSARSPTKVSTYDYSSTRDVMKPSQFGSSNTIDDEVVVISSETKHSSKQNRNSERIIETEIITDDNKHSPHGYPSVKGPSSQREASPRYDSPSSDYPTSPRKTQPNEDFSTHGFPSARSPTKTSPDYSTHGFPSARDAKSSPRPTQSPTRTKAQPTSSTSRKSSTMDTTKKLIHKEKEVDAAHRAFAASLRSSSPVDSSRRESLSDSHRQTPRSSISSTKTYRRDLREGSHESAVPSETSRISSSTVTRQSPSKNVGKTVVTKQTVVKTRNVNGSNETIDLTPQRSTKSPSPVKTVTTTTTTTTTTANKKTPNEVPKPDNPITPSVEKLFPINEPLTIAKTNFSSNDASFPRNEAVEEPCLKKRYYKLGPSENTTNVSDDAPNKGTHQELLTSTPQTNTDTETATKTTTSDDTVATTYDINTNRTAADETKQPHEKVVKHVTYANNEEKHKLLEKPSHSPAPSSPQNRTHSKMQTPTRDDNFEVIHEPITEPSNTFDNRSPSNQNPQESVFQQKSHPRGPSVERRTVVNKISLNQIDQEDDSINRSERRSPVRSISPEHSHRPSSRQNAAKPTKQMDSPRNNNKTILNENKIIFEVEQNTIEEDNKSPDANRSKKQSSPERTHKTTVETNFDINKDDFDFPTRKNLKRQPLNHKSSVPEQLYHQPIDNKSAPLKGHPSDKHDEPKRSTSPKKINKPSIVEEALRVDKNDKHTKDKNTVKKINEDLITIERQQHHNPASDEYPDGGYVSKSRQPTPTSPSFKKKGLSHRETFEDRCRQILGMEEDGDTQGNFKQSPTDDELTDVKLTTGKEPKPVSHGKLENVFEVKIEDCDDDEPIYLSNVKETLQVLNEKETRKNTSPRHQPTSAKETQKFIQTEIVSEKDTRKDKDSTQQRRISENKREPYTEIDKNDVVLIEKKDTTRIDKSPSRGPVYVDTRGSKSPEAKKKIVPESPITSDSETTYNESEVDTEKENFVTETTIRCNDEFVVKGHFRTPSPEGSQRRSPKPTSAPEQKTRTKSPNKKQLETPIVTKSSTDKTFPIKLPHKITPQVINETNVKHNEKQQISKTTSTSRPLPEFPRPKKEVLSGKTRAEPSPRKPSTDSTTSNIKERLRSSTRKLKPKTDDVDAISSPDTSPIRGTERRRSSNISVHTEIIIDHTGPKSPTQKQPGITSAKNPIEPKKQTVRKESVERTMRENLINRKMPVTERKESAPVHRVTRIDKDAKMSRSTSENVIKVSSTTKPNKKPEINTVTSSSPSKTDRRPNKCLTTKTINLTTRDKLINSEEMENVVIDIQHAKSSREPSPDKLIPIPVPIDLDTGKPRFPDVVQEPEDEPRKKPIVKNIPIFEEESNDFVGCSISEVNIERSMKTTDYTDCQDEILYNPIVEAPKSLEYPSIDKPDDDCLLSVHEKVSKFTHTAEEVKRPKSSSPFNRQFDQTQYVPENDECLLTVDQKVNKFIKTANNITHPSVSPVREIERPSFDDLDDDLRQDECILSVSQKVDKFINTAEKLAPTAPQKSPELVARMERHISRQSEPEQEDEKPEDEPLVPFSENHTTEIELKRQKDILSRPSVWNKPKSHDEEKTTTSKVSQNKATKVKSMKTSHVTEIVHDKETESMNQSNTTTFELNNRKSIPKQPEFYEKQPYNHSTAMPTAKKSIISDKIQRFDIAKQSPLDDNKKSIRMKPDKEQSVPRVEAKPRKVKPTNVDDRKNNTIYKNSVISSTTTSRHETERNKSPKRKPSTDLKKIISIDDDDYRTIEDSEHQTTDTETEAMETSYRNHTSKTTEYRSKYGEPGERYTKINKNIPEKYKRTEPVSHSPTSATNTNINKRTTNKTTSKITERTVEHLEPTETEHTDITKTILEPTPKAKSSPNTTGRIKVITESVAARRNIFEKGVPSKPAKPASPVQTGRRPSYMDHTKSSLEHTRRDSLEITKSNYSRKSSIDEDNQYERRPNSAVKFDVPQKSRPVSDDIDIESIFDLAQLEELLEIVTSYELRRRIRAQIRLVKNNVLNTQSQMDKKKLESKQSTTISSTHKKTSSNITTGHREDISSVSDERYSEKHCRHRSHSPHQTTKIQPEETDRRSHDRSPSPTEHTKKPQDRSRGATPAGKERFVETVLIETKSRERSRSPEAKTISSSLKEVRRTSGPQTSTSKHYTCTEQVDYTTAVESDKAIPSPSKRSKSPLNKATPQSPGAVYSKTTESIRRSQSPEKHLPYKTHTNGRSPPPKNTRRHEEITTTQKTTTRSSNINERKTSDSTTIDRTPIWVDRKNVLKTPNTTTRKTPSSPITRTSAMKTVKSSSQHQSKTTAEEDCITSSYGIGPTDENGLPLFGIRALKKKKPAPPCETTEKVTGYVVEEKYYSDGKTKPIVQRKEYVYSTNADELESIKKEVESRKASNDDGIVRRFHEIDSEFINDETEPNLEEFTTSTTRSGRRGSVKELSEKFIRKESSQSITEKTSGYPKAGLILLTNVHLGATDVDDSSTTTDIHKKTKKVVGHEEVVSDENDADDAEYAQMRTHHSSRSVKESEGSESESINVSRAFSKKSTSSSTRSFLNSSGESKTVTGVDDVLERMRNADNVTEEGDTPEDREARALLNKFLGASVIMSGVETILPAKTTTTRNAKNAKAYTKSDGDHSRKQEVQTTRVTKTTKSGSSSSPVTRTTCAIEDIWDEEILKALLEQATTYEERRKIRARLRELMADREAKSRSKASESTALDVDEKKKHEEEEDESSGSEYEEIIEEVTDYSEAEEEHDEVKVKVEGAVSLPNTKEVETKKLENLEIKTTLKEGLAKKEVKQPDSKPKPEPIVGDEKKASSKVGTECSVPSEVQVGAKGESLIPLLQDLLLENMPQSKSNNPNSKSNNSHNNNTNTKSTSTSSNRAGSQSSCSERSMLTVSNTSSKGTTTATTSGYIHTKDPQQRKQLTTTTTTTTNSRAADRSTGTTNEGSGSGGGNRLSVPPKEDSGTESGEDLRLIAAGLRDQLHMQSDSNLIQEVTAALSRLESSLKEGKDISVDGNKRNALLALVARLQTGLTAPEKLSETALMAALAEMDANEAVAAYNETSSPEADAHRCNRQRFAKRRNRNSRHTVGVSREELEDARRYMEDMIMMESISNCATPDGSVAPVTPPSFPLEKNASSGALLSQQLQLQQQQTTPSSPLFRPNHFVANNLKSSTEYLSAEMQSVSRTGVELRMGAVGARERRPLSGNYAVTFEQPQLNNAPPLKEDSPDSASKWNRFSNKKLLMKRANTIDIPKTKKYNPDFDTDSEMEERGPQFGLKRTVQVSVKQKTRNVIPPFEPKTENDHKFLAFINKQSAKPGLGWNGTRSVSNWTNKFGSIKHNFEVGAVASATTGKPPPAPGHIPQQNASRSHWGAAPTHPAMTMPSHQQNYQRGAQDVAAEQQRRLQQERHDRERLERDRQERQRQERQRQEREFIRIENDRLERQRQERERIERDRLEREFFERQRQEQEYRATEQHAAMTSMTATTPKAAHVNQFIHAPQSVFRPIEQDAPAQAVFKPIAQLPTKPNTWQPPSTAAAKPRSHVPASSPKFLQSAAGGTPYVTTPSPTNRSPIGMPWLSQPTVDNRDFRIIANRFEERSQHDNRQNPPLQRHNSLRTPKYHQQQQQPADEYRKRPSLPNTTDPYQGTQTQYAPFTPYVHGQRYAAQPQQPPPPPTNVSFTYADYTPGRSAHYQSYPCLSTAVDATAEYARSRDDSLTNPQALPLVLTSANPSYSPPPPVPTSLPYATRLFDYASPVDSAPTSPSIMTLPQIDCTDDDLDSDNMLEYRVQSKVMRKPQGQTAVTVGRRTAHVSDDEVFGKNSRAARSLLHTMKSIGQTAGGGGGDATNDSGNGYASDSKQQKSSVPKRHDPPTSPSVCLSPDGRAYQAPLVEPLFPQITNFEPNRSPMFVPQSPPAQPQHQSSSTPAYAPGKPSKPTARAPQIQQPPALSQLARNDAYYQEQQIQSQQQPNLGPAPYVSDTQMSYVVTYPVDEQAADNQEQTFAKTHPNSLPLQRIRNASENSTASSSLSYSLPSPGTTWTTNPIRVQEPPVPRRKTSQEQLSRSEDAYLDQHIISNRTHEVQQTKPDLAPKPALPPLNINAKQKGQGQQKTLPSPTFHQQDSPMPKTPKQHPQQESLPSPSSYREPAPPPRQRQQQPQESLPSPASYRETAPPPRQYPPEPLTSPAAYQPPPEAAPGQYQQQSQARLPADRHKLAARSNTITSSSQSKSFERLQQRQPTSLLRQRTLDADATMPLQTHNRVMSQQSLVSKQQSQFEQQHHHQQQTQTQQQHITEVRRKSLGNAFDVQQQESKSAYFESQQELRQEYKSSAPADTPDIVKSSLPKDESAPILKKFGPPQRHHYMPNSYQSPLGGKQSTVSSHSTKVSVKTKVRSTLSARPAIVETPATPQPEDLIPRNIVFNNISAFTSMAGRRQDGDYQPPRSNKLSKSDSWNQIVQLQNLPHVKPVSPKFNGGGSGNELRRTKSGHTLALPKMYEAGIDKAVVSEKQRTVAAYFSGNKSPNSAAREEDETASRCVETTTTRRSAINRTKTSEKVTASRKSLSSFKAMDDGATTTIGGGGLMRSATMPHIANLHLLDESNVEDAFEQLMMGS